MPVMRPFKRSIADALAPMSAPPRAAEMGVKAMRRSYSLVFLPLVVRTAS